MLGSKPSPRPDRHDRAARALERACDNGRREQQPDDPDCLGGDSTGGCCCGPEGGPSETECPVALLILCEVCGDLKKNKCRKGACKKAREEAGEGDDEEEQGEDEPDDE